MYTLSQLSVHLMATSLKNCLAQNLKPSLTFLYCPYPTCNSTGNLIGSISNLFRILPLTSSSVTTLVQATLLAHLDYSYLVSFLLPSSLCSPFSIQQPKRAQQNQSQIDQVMVIELRPSEECQESKGHVREKHYAQCFFEPYGKDNRQSEPKSWNTRRQTCSSTQIVKVFQKI